MDRFLFFKPFKNRSFTLIFLTTVMTSLGDILMDVSSGWLVLNLTDSPLSLGLLWAMRSMPNLLFGMIAGATADKMNRKKLLILCYSLYAMCGLIFGLLIIWGQIQLPHTLAIIFVRGVIRAFEIPTRQSFIVDIVGVENAMIGISLNAVGLRGIGIIGAALAGFIIELFGEEWAFFTFSGVFIASILLVVAIRKIQSKRVAQQHPIWRNIVEGIQIVKENRIVLSIMIMVATCEMFGFSFPVLVPVFARDILMVGSVGLGMINAFRSGGGFIISLVLAGLGDYEHKGKLLIGLYLLFGVGLVLYANSGLYVLALFFMGVIGVSAAGHDAMSQILLQMNVDEEQRGRAMGIWQLSIGFGLIGSMMLGSLAEIFGAPLAQSVFGVVMVLIAGLMYMAVPKLRAV